MLSAVEEHAISQELIAKELKALRNRERAKWMRGKKNGSDKVFQRSRIIYKKNR